MFNVRFATSANRHRNGAPNAHNNNVETEKRRKPEFMFAHIAHAHYTVYTTYRALTKHHDYQEKIYISTLMIITHACNAKYKFIYQFCATMQHE